MLSDPSGFVTNTELEARVRTLRSEFPEMGETMTWGYLRSAGLHVSRERVRTALRLSDPLNSALRWQGTLTRRVNPMNPTEYNNN